MAKAVVDLDGDDGRVEDFIWNLGWADEPEKMSGQEGLWPLEGGTGGSAVLFSDLGGSDFFSETSRHGEQKQSLVARGALGLGTGVCLWHCPGLCGRVCCASNRVSLSVN
ncbi:hypothetical protein, partial [Devosia elaeis]|uniref:hypothetical protein n=1 Tax=Devosia elaeis TaxID=1770058 RepID=UPI00196A0F25